jgi:hypothetical protein
MLNCLNGPNNALGPYRDAVDKMSDDDLGLALEIFNKHFFSNSERRNQVFDLIRKLHQTGELKAFLNSIAATSDSFVTLAPLLAEAFESDRAHFDNFASYFLTTVDQNKVTPILMAVANYFGGSHSQTFASLLSLPPPQVHPLNLDQTVDLVADILNSSLEDGSLTRLLRAWQDPSLLLSSLAHPLSDQERRDVSLYLNFAVQDPTTLAQVQRLAKVANNTVGCFTTGTQRRQVDNLFYSTGRDLLSLESGVPTQDFFARTLPLM